MKSHVHNSWGKNMCNMQARESSVEIWQQENIHEQFDIVAPSGISIKKRRKGYKMKAKAKKGKKGKKAKKGKRRTEKVNDPMSNMSEKQRRNFQSNSIKYKYSTATRKRGDDLRIIESEEPFYTSFFCKKS